MDTISGNICREFKDKVIKHSFIIKIFQPFLGTLTMLSILPAFSYGCTEAADNSPTAQISCRSEIMLSNDRNEIRTLDIFVFKDDIFQKLDCYQRVDDPGSWNNTVISGNGERLVTAIANSGYKRTDWLKLNSRSFLKGMTINLEDEDRKAPIMSGEIYMNAGEQDIGGKETLVLLPFASEVLLNSICCDFTGRPYEGETLSEARVYLTNVNAECGLMDEEHAAPRRIINAGGLSENDTGNFWHTDMIMQEIPEDIGKRKLYPDIRLWCYQSNHPDETPGTPYTRLVIEGKISGQTYYWPININRDTHNETGVWRNRRYIYDIMITRKGSTDPDKPVKTSDINIIQEVARWKDIKEYEVSF